jgi:hypothetical protein
MGIDAVEWPVQELEPSYGQGREKMDQKWEILWIPDFKMIDSSLSEGSLP